MSDLKEREEIRNALKVIKSACEEIECECGNLCPFYKEDFCMIQNSCPADWKIVDKYFWKVLD